jgi:hypothetical protein
MVIGIGGGGDVVGALAVARFCERFGLQVMVGGVTWERRPIDAQPGPRSLDEIENARPIARHVALAGPQTRTPSGALFAESHMARFLGQDTILIDVLAGPAAIADSMATAASELDVDLVLCVDVGGDVLGQGTEPGLASPLCDAVMLAAAAELQSAGLSTVAGIFGPCCDGELTLEELLDRIAELSMHRGLLGTSTLTPEVVAELERAVELVPTEASAQAIRCARGEIGWTTIRNGRRKVLLSPVGALSFYFDPQSAVGTVARLARAVTGTGSLDEANERLHELGVHTELDFERSLVETS